MEKRGGGQGCNHKIKIPGQKMGRKKGEGEAKRAEEPNHHKIPPKKEKQ